jgi:hypothetical protein
VWGLGLGAGVQGQRINAEVGIGVGDVEIRNWEWSKWYGKLTFQFRISYFQIRIPRLALISTLMSFPSKFCRGVASYL